MLITDEVMHELLTKSRAYSVVLLKATPKRQQPGADAIIWEHGRRNFSLRAEGVLAVVGPVTDDSGWSGVGIFDATVEEATRIMDDDPGVQAGIFTYEVHPIRSFPGDYLPG
jgi:uncharacterized protein YciI